MTQWQYTTSPSRCGTYSELVSAVVPLALVIIILTNTNMLDYNEEARKLFASLDGSKPSRFNNLDPIYRSEAGGFIYVGGDLVGFTKHFIKDIKLHICV